MLLNLPGDVWTMLIILGLFMLLPLLIIYLGYRFIR
jgi:hypothetical protein